MRWFVIFAGILLLSSGCAVVDSGKMNQLEKDNADLQNQVQQLQSAQNSQVTISAQALQAEQDLQAKKEQCIKDAESKREQALNTFFAEIESGKVQAGAAAQQDENSTNDYWNSQENLCIKEFSNNVNN